MKEEEFLSVLKNIYGSLTYEDWFHAREYIKLEIEKLEEIIEERKN